MISGVGYDYTYSNITGDIVIFDAVTNDAGEDFQYRMFGMFSTKQIIYADSINQTDFNYSGSPSSIDVYLKGQILFEDIDFTRTRLSEGNTLTLINTDLINYIKISDRLEIRKF